MLGSMTTPFVCVLIAYLLVYVPKLPLSVAMARQPGGYDNKDPRAQQAKLEGMGARARGAHYNGLEAFPAFAAAVLVAHVAGAADHRASILAISFVVARSLYIAAYLADLDYLRSAIWGIGFLCTVALFCLPWLG
jgi:uncharacterized MAPEG superfamily protein